MSRPRKKKGNPQGNKGAFKNKPLQAKETLEVVGMRLNKYVAHCGVCSRRQAADFIKDGLVAVNGEVLDRPGYQIQEGDEVTFKGELIKPEENLVYILMNKPRGVITTVKDDRGRKTVIDIIGDKVKERIFSCGQAG